MPALSALVTGSQAAVPTLAVLSDIRTGRPGSTDESACGDAAAAFVFGSSDGPAEAHPVIAEVVAHDSVSEELLERWRLPGAASSRVWEERVAAEVYVGLAREALDGALSEAGWTASDLDHFAVADDDPIEIERHNQQ